MINEGLDVEHYIKTGDFVIKPQTHHEKMLDDARSRLKFWHKKFEEHPEYWDEPGMCDILRRAEEDVEKLRRLVELDRVVEKRKRKVRK